MNYILQRDDLNLLGKFAVEEFKRELVFQKHVASAELLNSIEYKIVNTSTGLSLQIWAAGHAFFVNDGRKARVKRVPIAALMEWIKIKGIATDDKEAKSIAFAIQETIYREGIPTSGGRRIASRRLNFIQQVSAIIDNYAKELINTKIQDNLRSELNKWFRQANRELNGR